MSLRNDIFNFTGCKKTFFGSVYKDVNYLPDPNKIHLTQNSPEVISNGGFFINQVGGTPHFFHGKKGEKEAIMVKLRGGYYFLFKEYIGKTKGIITLKCKEVFERACDDEVINFLIKDEGIKTINPQIAKNILANIKNITSNRVHNTLSSTKSSQFTIEQPGGVTHYISGKMVKLKHGLLDLLVECLNKTKGKISLKCKQVFEKGNLAEIKEFIKHTKETEISSDYDLLHN